MPASQSRPDFKFPSTRWWAARRSCRKSRCMRRASWSDAIRSRRFSRHRLRRIGAAEAIVARIRAEIGATARVIASGGLASVLAGETPVIERVEPHLVLFGLRAHYNSLER